MAPYKSQDDSGMSTEIIDCILRDINMNHGAVFNSRSLRLTRQKVRRRLSTEGPGFLTKTLPTIGKAFDRALCSGTYDDDVRQTLRLEGMPDAQLPKLFGELFARVFDSNGKLLQQPCVESVKVIRQVCALFYKYELPYTSEQEAEVIRTFKQNELDLNEVDKTLELIRVQVDCIPPTARRYPNKSGKSAVEIVREARILLAKVFSSFDPRDIDPRHGPGAVATKQKLWAKYRWTNVSKNITNMYPLDEYFFTSLTHVCDSQKELNLIGDEDLPARVILVPKDSRGPRLISCEPVDYQWIQQGLGRAIVRHVEQHKLTQRCVRFTDQQTNRNLALIGSEDGSYATLDLKEASDRISLELVRLLYPEHIYMYLFAARSSATELPNGEVLSLKKFAPMGSCLCFPIMALTIWALLAAAAPDAHTRECVNVYGDDVIVPSLFSDDAIKTLETFGLKTNSNKCCTTGLFRESCGMDAFRGEDVTPVRIRTVWSTSRSAGVYASWCSYANNLRRRGYNITADMIGKKIVRIYGNQVPDVHTSLRSVPYLDVLPDDTNVTLVSRWNARFQRREFRVWGLRNRRVRHNMPGWSMLLRYFSEAANDRNRRRFASAWDHQEDHENYHAWLPEPELEAKWLIDDTNWLDVAETYVYRAFRSRSYTRRDTSMLVSVWR